jgi:hypothetical protein
LEVLTAVPESITGFWNVMPGSLEKVQRSRDTIAASALLGFWTLSIAWYSKKHKRHKISFVFFRILDDGQRPKT